VGNISFYDPQGRNQFMKPYSEDLARVIDEEVSKLIEQQYPRALSILKDNKDKLGLLAEKLLEKEVIFKEDLVSIFGKQAWAKEEVEEEEEEVEEVEEEEEEEEEGKDTETMVSKDPDTEASEDKDPTIENEKSPEGTESITENDINKNGTDSKSSEKMEQSKDEAD
jgi:hypothetical protein